MSDHPHAIDEAQALERAHPIEHPHPSALRYIQIAVILAVITGFEVWVYYLEQAQQLLPWILVCMSALKFGLVASFYMHLRYDSRLFTAFFVGGLLLAASIVIAFMTLFGVWTRIPAVEHVLQH